MRDSDLERLIHGAQLWGAEQITSFVDLGSKLLVSWVGELVLVEKQCQELHSKLLRLNMEQLLQQLQAPGPTNREIDKEQESRSVIHRS